MFAKYLWLTGISVALFNTAIRADDSVSDEQIEKAEPTKEELMAPEYLKKLSQTYGHFMRKNLNRAPVKLHVADVIKGLEDAEEGKAAPLKPAEFDEAFRLIEKYAEEEMLQQNLEEAENFLKENSKLEGVVELEPGKIQYKILQPGQGEILTVEMVPTIHYSATYLNGINLGSSDQHGGPIEVPLDETITGFRLGMLGMHVGEKRRLFIHPDRGYKTSGQLPNGLLIFDIEVTSVAPKPPQTEIEEGVDTDSDDEVDSHLDTFDSNDFNTFKENIPDLSDITIDDINDDQEEINYLDDSFDIPDFDSDEEYEDDDDDFRPPMMIDSSDGFDDYEDDND